jgi:hypothetical protein
MTAPKTRLEEGTTDFERDMLRSWQHEQPSAQARKSALGIGVAGALAGATTAAAATGAAGTAIAEGLAPKATAFALGAIVKWLAAGAVVVSGAVLAVPHLRSASPVTASVVVEQAPGPPSSVETALPPDPVIEPTMGNAAPAADPVPTAPETIAQASTPRSSSPRPIARAAHAAPEPTVEVPAATDPPPEEKHSSRALGEQVVTIDRAESALAAGNVSEALRLVNDYETRFPTGSLSQEAAVLRIEALSKQGKREEAAALANRFLAAHPSSPYAAKLRRRLEGDSIR